MKLVGVEEVLKNKEKENVQENKQENKQEKVPEKVQEKVHERKPEFKKKNGKGGGFKPRPAPKSAVDGFIGRDIILKMRDGTFENGRLESIFQYEYIIIGEDGLPHIILKHAVDSIRVQVIE